MQIPAADMIVKLAAEADAYTSSGYDCEVSSGKQMHIPAADMILKLAEGSRCRYQQRI